MNNEYEYTEKNLDILRPVDNDNNEYDDEDLLIIDGILE